MNHQAFSFAQVFCFLYVLISCAFLQWQDLNDQKKFGQAKSGQPAPYSYGSNKRSLGAR
jgi:hypothetical protein